MNDVESDWHSELCATMSAIERLGESQRAQARILGDLMEKRSALRDIAEFGDVGSLDRGLLIDLLDRVGL